MIRAISHCLALSMALSVGGPAKAADTRATLLAFDDLDGWEEDSHAEALAAFRLSCMDFDTPDWDTLCALAAEVPDARLFFEAFFVPVMIEDGEPGLFTAYFEPELRGALEPDERFRYPLYRTPPDTVDGAGLTRREIEAGKALEGQNLEIAWVEDPVDLFFLQVQGSGRIRLDDGSVIRVGYGSANRHPYTSIGATLVSRGVFEPHEVSADVIRNWVRRNPEPGQELLWTNASYVYFREVEGLAGHFGPLGAMNRPITRLRSIAIDPSVVPLGAPVWIEKDGAEPMRRLTIAQDTGSAIKGAQRADVFFGTGSAAGRRAGRVRDPGRMVVLLPIQRAYAMLPESLE